MNVTFLAVHEYYNPSTLDNDSGVLQVDGGFDLDNPTTRPVQFENCDEVEVHSSLFVSGFGRTLTNEDQTLLRAVEVFKISLDFCTNAYTNTASGTFPVTDSMFCAGIKEVGGQDACQGDSGSGLVYKNEKDDSLCVVGVVSWGIGCAHRDYPGVYARISSATDFIAKTIAERENLSRQRL